MAKLQATIRAQRKEESVDSQPGYVPCHEVNCLLLRIDPPKPLVGHPSHVTHPRALERDGLAHMRDIRHGQRSSAGICLISSGTSKRRADQSPDATGARQLGQARFPKSHPWQKKKKSTRCAPSPRKLFSFAPRPAAWFLSAPAWYSRFSQLRMGAARGPSSIFWTRSLYRYARFECSEVIEFTRCTRCFSTSKVRGRLRVLWRISD